MQHEVWGISMKIENILVNKNDDIMSENHNRMAKMAERTDDGGRRAEQYLNLWR